MSARNHKINSAFFQNIFLYLALLPTLFMQQAMAASPSHGAGHDAGGVAEDMLESVGLFGDFVNAGCLMLGVSFLFASLVKYIEHRRSPLMVPISTVVFLLIGGSVLLLIP